MAEPSCFNPHTHTGCDPWWIRCSGALKKFQSTHPYRVWPMVMAATSFHTCFNPHTHTGCDSRRALRPSLTVSFNPHTHTGCDGLVERYWPNQDVSIHTPIQGVTWLPSETFVLFLVSIHTPIQGVTPQGYWLRAIQKVSIHTPIQGVTQVKVEKSAKIKFQSTHPYRVWLVVVFAPCSAQWFQSTHPYRVWLNARMFTRTMPMFQSTHPYRVWQRKGGHLVRFWAFQSTHPYRVWRNAADIHISSAEVSIHTPIQGVTYCLLFSVPIFDVSIHTPIQGVTWSSETIFSLSACFNPHTHTGCDLFSISSSLGIFCFNPHTHTGCDFRFHQVFVKFSKFQSTHPYRVWLAVLCSNSSVALVSIHTPIQGVTFLSNLLSVQFGVSIHTPIQGVTHRFWQWTNFGRFQSTHPYRVWHAYSDNQNDHNQVSIHTPIQGVTSPNLAIFDWLTVSIHTPIQGVTQQSVSSYAAPKRFQSTHPYRVWRHGLHHPCLSPGFNPHTHTGCDLLDKLG